MGPAAAAAVLGGAAQPPAAAGAGPAAGGGGLHGGAAAQVPQSVAAAAQLPPAYGAAAAAAPGGGLGGMPGGGPGAAAGGAAAAAAPPVVAVWPLPPVPNFNAALAVIPAQQQQHQQYQQHGPLLPGAGAGLGNAQLAGPVVAAAAAAGGVGVPGGAVPAPPQYAGQFPGLGPLGAGAGGQVGAAAAQAAGPQGPQLGAVGGGGGVPPASPLAAMVSPMQLAIVAGAAETDVRRLVRQSGVFDGDACTLDQARNRLVLAVWAAEQQRSADDVRGLAGGVAPFVLSEFSIPGQWAQGLQDTSLNTLLQACRSAPWAVDPSLSLGLLSAARVAALNILAVVTAQNSGHCAAEAELRSSLSAQEFQSLEAALTSSGRTFRDMVKVAGAWSFSSPGSNSSSVSSGSVLAGASSSSGPVCMMAHPPFVGNAFNTRTDSSAQRLAEIQVSTLCVDTFALFSAKEIVELRGRNKSASSSGSGYKRERSYPGATDAEEVNHFAVLNEWPWRQQLLEQSSYSFSMLGRMLRLALSFWSEHMSEDSVGSIKHNILKEEQTKFYNEFLQAAASGAEGHAAVLAPTFAPSYAHRRMREITVLAAQRAGIFPDSDMFRFILEQRNRQLGQLDPFLTAVQRRMSEEMDTAHTMVKVRLSELMWQEFLGGWMASSYSPEFCEAISSEWQKLKQTGFRTISPSVTSSVLSQAGSGGQGGGGGLGSVGGGGAAVSGLGGGTPGGGTLGAAGQGQLFKRTIPWSIDIVGNALGVKTTVVCSNCKKGRLHHSAECPKRWAASGAGNMPGFLADGNHDPTQWAKGKEPIRATVEAWVALLEDHSKWGGAAPVRFGVQGAPSLAEFKRRVPLAPVKP